MSRLTVRQEQFCHEYLIDLNATQAAIRAGYSEHTAREIGSENLTKPHIKNRIKALKQDRALRLAKKRMDNHEELADVGDRIIRELEAIAFADPFDFLEIVDGTLQVKQEALIGEGAGAIRRLGILKHGKNANCPVIYLDFQNKLRAIELLMRHYGMIRTSSSPDLPKAPVKITVISTYDPDKGINNH